LSNRRGGERRGDHRLKPIASATQKSVDSMADGQREEAPCDNRKSEAPRTYTG
jgi:hypothetical protein